jgi:hypothetical protein
VNGGTRFTLRLWCADGALVERSWRTDRAVRRSAADDGSIHRATSIFAGVIVPSGLAETDIVERAAR